MAKILIVDDSEALRTELRKDLESHGHIVSEGFDGLDGLAQLAKSENTELIICDVNMPRMDGFSMCAKVSEDAKNSNIKLFMLTTEASPGMKVRGKEVGVKAWITKPYALDKLLQAIDKICAK